MARYIVGNRSISPSALRKHRFLGNHDRTLVPTRLSCLNYMRRLTYENDGDPHVLLTAAKFARAARTTQSENQIMIIIASSHVLDGMFCEIRL